MVRKIQSAAGKRLGHDVEPRFDPFQERWVIFAFDKKTGRVDYPYHIVVNPDGSYRPLDNRVVKELQGTQGDLDRINKKRRRKWLRGYNKQRRAMALMLEYGYLTELRANKQQYCEASAALDKKIDDIMCELNEIHDSDDEMRESAENMVRLLRQQVSVGASSGQAKSGTLWTPGN